VSLNPVLAEKLSAALGPAAATRLTRRDAVLPAVPGKVHAVIGMRRAGKTTFLRQLLEERRGRAALERALYLSFDDDRLAGLQTDQLGYLLWRVFWCSTATPSRGSRRPASRACQSTNGSSPLRAVTERGTGRISSCWDPRMTSPELERDERSRPSAALVQRAADLSGYSVRWPELSKPHERLADPGQQMLEVAAVLLQKAYEKPVGLLRLDPEFPAVQSQEYVGGEEGHALVPVEEGVVHEQRLEERRRHLGDVTVVAGAWAKQGAFEETEVADAGRTTELFKKPGVDGKDLIHAQMKDPLTRQGGGPAPRSRPPRNPDGGGPAV